MCVCVCVCVFALFINIIIIIHWNEHIRKFSVYMTHCVTGVHCRILLFKFDDDMSGSAMDVNDNLCRSSV